VQWRQSGSDATQLGRQGQGLVSGQQLHIGHPQAVLQLFAVVDQEPRFAFALDDQQTRLRLVQLGDARQRAHRVEGFLHKTAVRGIGLLHFVA